ncbi:MAG: dUTP diphosphatase [Paenibacillaceae bacterium]|nr:dUTP diphosphatase [Paenibacillaceae bacterium]
MIRVAIQCLPNAVGLPKKMTQAASGFDLCAAIEAPTVLRPMERLRIPTGIALAMPDGLEAQVRPRSGLALRYGITTLNSPGTIDADYRGEVCVLLINLGAEDVVIERGMRIAQLVFHVVPTIAWDVVEELPQTARGTGGFGHTGA